MQEEVKQPNKKFFKNKKVMIPVISLLVIIFILSMTLTILFIPRRLNKYIKCRLDEVQEMYIVDYRDNRFDIPKNEYEDVFEKIKEIKVQPLTSPLKTFTEYSLYIKSAKKICKINGYHIIINGRRKSPCKIKNMDQFEELLNQYINVGD